ncbi:Tocopherol cyclase [Oscillibacter sp. PC13]|uniref:tocopherol cyclase family protein n=1 Tax=Oscillibacter sp. PC13 TaxID=1855299 RepID=UPI0008F151F5|nr:tocopherol cyclase family protein [Oscillibacter sp. PC13]SFP25803.1 Tocopherol cyclase [Oscillibacter sp. PC13]
MGNHEYFCGWYFKCQSQEESLALIPAVHTECGKQTSSLQLISSRESWNVPLSSQSCQIRADRPYAKLGESVFSEYGIQLNLHTTSFSAVGSLQFSKHSPIRFDIMGPFCCVPFMECRHRVFSMQHEVNGSLQINGRIHRFENSIGYIEGDRGHSFPKQYLWTQCCFENGSLMLAAADIPLGPICFTGIIGVIHLGGREYRLATYLGAKVVSLKNREITIQQGDLRMTAALLDEQAHPLQAPVSGAMARTIRENIACHARYQLFKKDRMLLSMETQAASFEYEYP